MYFTHVHAANMYFSKSCLTLWFWCRKGTLVTTDTMLKHIAFGQLVFFSIFCEETRLCSVYYVKRILKVDGFCDFCCFLLISLKEAGDWCQIRFFW